MDKNKKTLKKIISNEDRGIIACSKTLFFNNDQPLFYRMKNAIEAFNQTQLSGDANEQEKNLLIEGAALMYHLMKNENFLKINK